MRKHAPNLIGALISLAAWSASVAAILSLLWRQH